MWWHKHHLWMTYESIVSGIFPFFRHDRQAGLGGHCVGHCLILCCIQLIGLVKAAYACLLHQNIVMLFMWLYSVLYMTSLLPLKYFTMFTIKQKSWGTSGRRKMVANYVPLLPLSLWAAILLSGLGYAIYRETQQDWSSDSKKNGS
ncbi:hypothetical protein ILYODFUR_034992 [Ilyodon furcidens]|uniref:Uncharacterized protein n=1 Tax=Ilyodon furcidens TaxID=33524 RepID=A0ABV0V998_9TELE